jgi:AraC-like DNA-binding protein
MNGRTRPIGHAERTGVLAPGDLRRLDARWVAPAPAVSEVVDTYWSVDWELPPGATVEQRIIDFPAITLSVEAGEVPGPLMLTAVRPRAWSRTIASRGSVFAIRLRPAGLAVVSDLDPTSLAPEQELTAELDARAHELLRRVAAASTTDARADQADELILDLLGAHPPTHGGRLANAAVDALTSVPRVRSGRAVAEELGTGERSLQRALRRAIGVGPNDVARRIRVQEVARRLSTREASTGLAALAAELGYVDQAHLTNEFRRVAGVTPGRYARELHGSSSPDVPEDVAGHR